VEHWPSTVRGGRGGACPADVGSDRMAPALSGKAEEFVVIPPDSLPCAVACGDLEAGDVGVRDGDGLARTWSSWSSLSRRRVVGGVRLFSCLCLCWRRSSELFGWRCQQLS